jgi:cell division protein FtsB
MQRVIQEQQAEIEELKDMIEEQQAEIERLCRGPGGPA